MKYILGIEFGDAVLVGRLDTDLHIKKLQIEKERNRNEETNKKIRSDQEGHLTSNLLFQISEADKKGNFKLKEGLN